MEQEGPTRAHIHREMGDKKKWVAVARQQKSGDGRIFTTEAGMKRGKDSEAR